jgi:hypothetical protein
MRFSKNFLQIFIGVLILFITSFDLWGQNTDLFNKFAEKFSANFVDTNSVKKQFLKEGLTNVAEFLYEKDSKKFLILINQLSTPEQIRNFIYKNYNDDFIEFSNEYYYWANSRAEKKYQFKVFKSFNKRESENFIFFYNPQLPENAIEFLSMESENVLYKLMNLINPVSSSLNNFKRIVAYKAWLNDDLKANSGDLESTNGKIPIIVTLTQKEMYEIAGKQQHAEFGGYTSFSPTIQNDSVKFVCRSIINYSNPLSVVPLAHEIAHAFSFIIFTNSAFLDSLINIYHPSKFQDMKLDLWKPAMIRLTGVTMEGFGHWSGWHNSVFYEAGILPSVHELLLQRTSKLPSLKELISGDIDISFWDVVKKIFGSNPTYKIATYFVGSASFIDYLIYDSTPEQLYSVFSGGQDNLPESELEKIYGKRFNQIEAGWKNYVRNYKH